MQYFVANEDTVKAAIEAEKIKSFTTFNTFRKSEFRSAHENAMSDLKEVLYDVQKNNFSALLNRVADTQRKWLSGFEQ